MNKDCQDKMEEGKSICVTLGLQQEKMGQESK